VLQSDLGEALSRSPPSLMVRLNEDGVKPGKLFRSVCVWRTQRRVFVQMSCPWTGMRRPSINDHREEGQEWSLNAEVTHLNLPAHTSIRAYWLRV